jgi:serine/threonine protein kinase
MRRASTSEASISDPDGGPPPALMLPTSPPPALPRRENPLQSSPKSAVRPSPPSNSSQDPIGAATSRSEAGSTGGGELYIRRGHLIGQGAFGSVYLGMNMANSQLVAIKQIRLADANDSIIRSIQREMDVMMRLPPHPNCVRYLGHRESRRCVSVIMEFVSGGSVASLYNTVGVFHEATVRRYAAMALQGLAHLHRNGIVHQDIKGANVLADSEGVAKIADFGCCKDLNLLTGSMKTAGTPLWMAPEVCTGGSATTMSDIWSFGCFVLEMAKPDHMPWSNLNGGLFAVMYAIGNAKQPPPAPSTMSAEGKDFLARCMCIDPLRRATAEELLHHPWIEGPHTDNWDAFNEDLMPSATQTVITNPSGHSLDLGSDMDDDDDDDGAGARSHRGGAKNGDDDIEFGRVLRVPPPVMSPLSPASNEAMSPRSEAASRTPRAQQPVVWRSNGQVRVDDDGPNLMAEYAQLPPKDSSPVSNGRRKLGQRRSLFQKLWEWF